MKIGAGAKNTGRTKSKVTTTNDVRLEAERLRERATKFPSTPLGSALKAIYIEAASKADHLANSVEQ